ncbi:MAG TPA: molybdopterin-dependent oxidoreductase [Clostridia bacterium]|nr:molybdopterin-dependent oxidoreductase [Clostridia bacterium]
MADKHLVNFYPVLILVLVGLILAGCSQPAAEEKIPMEEWSITVEVVGGKTIEFTSKDALEIGPVEVTIAEKDKDTTKEPEQWTGVLLKDILEFAGATEFSVVSVEASDGYSREYEPDLVNSEGTALGWSRNGELLGEEDGFVKLVVDGKGKNWQIKQVAKIVVIP